jgi:hypothetical protein
MPSYYLPQGGQRIIHPFCAKYIVFAVTVFPFSSAEAFKHKCEIERKTV